MSDWSISVFELENARGLPAPLLEIHYTEEETGIEWQITTSGTRAYLVRMNSRPSGDALDPENEAADSHFMIRRVLAALLLGGSGLFHAQARGRTLMQGVEGEIVWRCMLEPFQVRGELGLTSLESNPPRVIDWYTAIIGNTFLRRAAEDAHTALSWPWEAFVYIYIYRGFEWITKGFGMSWDDLARELSVPRSQFKELKKMANYESGVRHASSSGTRMRANLENSATWVTGLFEAINVARSRIDSSFNRMSSEEIAAAVLKAATHPFL